MSSPEWVHTQIGSFRLDKADRLLLRSNTPDNTFVQTRRALEPAYKFHDLVRGKKARIIATFDGLIVVL